MWRGILIGLCLGTVVHAARVRLGVERFLELYRDSLRGRTLAVLTHAAARLPDGRLSVELLRENFRVAAIWVPEHGFWGAAAAGTPVPDDTLMGIPVYSLYGPRRRPTEELLRKIDAVVVDLQDVGIRPYTYVSTLVMVMDACAQQGIPVYVLDRPNPLGGTVVEGAVLDTLLRSFVGMLPIPYRYGCTLGELAAMLNGEGWLSRSERGSVRRCSLRIVSLQGWRRAMVWEETGLPWFPPSPNIPTPTAARAALITGVFGELGMWSVGIGTTTPFQVLGAPDFPAETLAGRLRKALDRLGVRVGIARFVPQHGRFAQQLCQGILLVPEARHDGRFFAAFVEIAEVLRHMLRISCRELSSQTQTMLARVLGQWGFVEAFCGDGSLRPWLTAGVEAFLRARERYLLYR